MQPGLDHQLRSGPPGIAAWLNPSLYPVGCIGQLSPKASTAVEEIQGAERWLKEQGCTHARGPLDGSTLFSYRANLGPFERPLFLGEPQAPAQPFINAGYQPVAHYSSSIAENDHQIQRGRAHHLRLSSQGWSLSTMNDVGGFQSALKHFHSITVASFQNAYSYSPISWPLFQTLYSPLETRVDPRLIRLAKTPDGDIAGYCFSIPDLLNPEMGQFIVKTLAVHPRWRQQRLGSWMVSEAHRLAQNAGYQAGIHALMWEQSHSQAISAHGGRVFRRYALYEKALT